MVTIHTNINKTVIEYNSQVLIDLNHLRGSLKLSWTVHKLPARTLKNIYIKVKGFTTE